MLSRALAAPPRTVRALRWRRHFSGLTRGSVYYQGDGVPTGTHSSGQVYTQRDLQGSDATFVGVNPVKTEVDVLNARGLGFSVDAQGFECLDHVWQHIDYFDNGQVLGSYYAECEALLRRHTGASRVLAFDHNLRASQRKKAGQMLAQGNAVQEPLIGYGIHNDYTATSAPARIRLLSQPPSENDTRRNSDGSPLIDPSDVQRLLSGRWAFFNVWRNVAATPVQRFPLALCDAGTVSTEDLIVFEIRYTDRVGENYFARFSDKHRWYFYPHMTRDEVVVLKCWDSRGKDFLEDNVSLRALANSESVASVPATFSLHTGFVDLQTPEDAPDRESIEVRCIAFWE